MLVEEAECRLLENADLRDRLTQLAQQWVIEFMEESKARETFALHKRAIDGLIEREYKAHIENIEDK